MSEHPLQDIRVIAVEQYGAGPYGSMYLADLGAEVIKIEQPRIGGDIARQTGPFFLGSGDSLFFQTFNLNKKSLALDLKNPRAREVFARLVESADAVMNNLRGDQPEKLGLTHASLAAVNPKVVCAHLSAYGRDNERADWPGYDYLMQAEAGFMSLTGEPDTIPARFGLSMVDYMTGVVTAAGLLAALISAMKTGRGRDVDVSLFDVALHQLSYPATWFLNEGLETTRVTRSAHPSTVPCQLFRTSDDWIFIMAMTPKFWNLLLELTGSEYLNDDPRFATVTARREHRDALTTILDAVLSTRTTDDWMELFCGKIPAAPIHNLQQALNNPYIHAIGMVQTTVHPGNPKLRTLSNPIKLDNRRLSGKACPTMGADTEAILTGLGYSQDEMQALRNAGAIG